MFEILEYERRDGVSPFDLWFKSLDKSIRAKVGNQILLLLGGGDKSSQQRDIEQAIENLNDYKRNK